ncbi:unnamed protein product, partial [marine sediment metagenome]
GSHLPEVFAALIDLDFIFCILYGTGGVNINTPIALAIQVGEIFELANIDGPGIIRHIWMTFSNRTPENLRGYIIRIFWDGLENPSVESPIGDFFGLMHGRVGHYSTPYLGVSEGKGFNCFFSNALFKKMSNNNRK